MRPSRRIRHFLGESNPYSSIEPFQKLTTAYRTALLSVRLFYVINLFLVFSMLILFWVPWRTANVSVSIWPLLWVNQVDFVLAVDIVCGTVLVAAILAALWPEKRFTRVLLLITIFELIAFTNAFGKINHGWHQWIYVTFFLAFLPNKGWGEPNTQGHKLSFVSIIWILQLALLLMYSMSGLWKIYAGFQQFSQGEIHAFHPYALAYLTADRLLQTNSSSILGPFIVRNPLIGWPLFVGAIYLETFSLIIAFRPSLHRIWGIGLSLFHIGVFLTMSIPFNFSLFVLGIFLVLSPLQPEPIPIRRAIESLPLFGYLFRKSLSSTLE